MGSKKNANQEPNSFWNPESLSTKLGLIAGLLGAILTVFDVYGRFSGIKKSSVEQQQKILELKKLQAEVSASAPQVDVEYVDLSYELFLQLSNSQFLLNRKQNLFLNYPIFPGEIVDNKVSIRPEAIFSTHDPSEDENERHITFLILQNKGKRDAIDVKVILDRLALPSKVQINETAGRSSGSYISQLKSAAKNSKDSSEVVINIPMPIETGKGFLIPLFVTRYATQSDDKQWDVISKIVYLPKILEISDPLDHSKQSQSIRQMKDPVRLESGVFGRG